MSGPWSRQSVTWPEGTIGSDGGELKSAVNAQPVLLAQQSGEEVPPWSHGPEGRSSVSICTWSF